MLSLSLFQAPIDYMPIILWVPCTPFPFNHLTARFIFYETQIFTKYKKIYKIFTKKFAKFLPKNLQFFLQILQNLQKFLNL